LDRAGGNPPAGAIIPAEVPPALAGRCSCAIRQFPPAAVASILLAAGRQRFQRKAALFARTREVHGEGEALYQSVAAALGYKGNELPFRLLAQRLPVRRLAVDPQARESLLFGVAGFIPWDDLRQLRPEARGLVRRLWRHWWKHRSSAGGLQIPDTAWRFGGQRPSNHPHRRLGALAALLGHWRAIRRMAAAGEWRSLERLLLGLSDPFWDLHYTIGSKPSMRRMALIGRERVQDLLANVFLPAFGDWKPMEGMHTPERSKSVRVAAARLLAGRHDVRQILHGMAHQQGLLELYEGFCRCDSSDCRNCPMPEQLPGWGASI
jgi:hypothetical protein